MQHYTWMAFTQDITFRVKDKQESILVKVIDNGGEIIRMNFFDGEFTTYIVFDKRKIDRERAKECAISVLFNYQLWCEKNLREVNWSVYEA